jgi:hypothetical protein
VRLGPGAVDPSGGLTTSPAQWEHAFVTAPDRPYLAREEIERMRRSIAMLQPRSMAMKREDAMRLLGDLGEVQDRLEQLRDGLRTLLSDEDS